MWIELPNLWIAILNCLGIPAAHLLVSWWASALPSSRFHPDSLLFRHRLWERGGSFYQKVFRVRSWKHRLPDAATWFGGIAKRRLESTGRRYLETFAIETCRGEFAHWLQILVISGFILWTPWPYSPVIIAYALLSNLPCVINLRHTRIRLLDLLGKRFGSFHDPAAPL